MKILSNICAVLLSLSLLSACQQGGMNKQGGGALIGGVAGGLLGSTIGGGEGKLVAVAVGTLAGAMIGGTVGRQLDEYDRQMMQRSSQQALEFSPTGRSVEWRNPDTGHSGAVTPTRTFKSDAGGYCREYQQIVDIGGQKEKAYGRACRQPDGSWKVVG